MLKAKQRQQLRTLCLAAFSKRAIWQKSRSIARSIMLHPSRLVGQNSELTGVLTPFSHVLDGFK